MNKPSPRAAHRIPTWLLLIIVALGIGLVIAQGGDRSVEFSDPRGESSAVAHMSDRGEA